MAINRRKSLSWSGSEMHLYVSEALLAIELESLAEAGVDGDRVQIGLALVEVGQLAAGERHRQAGPETLQSPQRRVVLDGRADAAAVELRTDGEDEEALGAYAKHLR